MLTLKETLVDLADCNSTLILLGDKAVGEALPLATAEAYCGLYQRIASEKLKVETLLGRPGAILDRLEPVYYSNTFWHRHFGNSDIEAYPDLVWERLAPIAAKPGFWLTATAGEKGGVHIHPIVRVLLYPFGWSTWVSLRITGEHTLGDLVGILRHFVKEPAFSLSPGPSSPQTLGKVFQHVAQGVWKDAFGGGRKTRLFNLPDVLSVTTVLNKFGGAPAVGALDKVQEETLRGLVCPGATPSQKPWKDLHHALPRGKQGAGNLDYALQDDYGVFIWADHLLKPQGRNREHLRCYHNNTFFSLLHAWQVSVFLEQATSARFKNKKGSAALDELISAAVLQMEHRRMKRSLYRNVCLLTFLEQKNVQLTIEVARQSLAS